MDLRLMKSELPFDPATSVHLIRLRCAQGNHFPIGWIPGFGSADVHSSAQIDRCAILTECGRLESI